MQDDRPLAYLVAEAVALAGGNTCLAGHAWVSTGGRACPQRYPLNCSQPVFKCDRCGIYDYGEPGGPGQKSCDTHCKYDADLHGDPHNEEDE